MKKHVECNEYTILLKESQDETLQVVVNGEIFILISDASISDTDEHKVVSFVESNYEKWAFGQAHRFDKFKFMKDEGSTCRDSKS